MMKRAYRATGVNEGDRPVVGHYYADVIRYTARANEPVPIEIDARVYGEIVVADLVARQP